MGSADLIPMGGKNNSGEYTIGEAVRCCRVKATANTLVNCNSHSDPIKLASLYLKRNFVLKEPHRVVSCKVSH